MCTKQEISFMDAKKDFLDQHDCQILTIISHEIGCGDLTRKKNIQCPSCGAATGLYVRRNTSSAVFCCSCRLGGRDAIGVIASFTEKRQGQVLSDLKRSYGSALDDNTRAEIAKAKAAREIENSRIEAERLAKNVRVFNDIKDTLYTAHLSVVEKYLTYRGIVELDPSISCRDGKNGSFEMVAHISNVDGDVIGFHRTFLSSTGVKLGRALAGSSEGTYTDGCAIRLGGFADTIGVAEGIESAMSARALYGNSMPVWSLLNAPMMAKFIAPRGVKKVIIFADNDQNLAGQNAGQALARKLTAQGIEVVLRTPNRPEGVKGWDYNDALKQCLGL